jgi:predicted transcriptional regulator
MNTRKLEKRNLTLSLPYALVRKAKELAVREDRSLNDYVRAAIEEKNERSSGYLKARERQLARLEKGLDLGTGGGKPAPRDNLHERD